MAEEAAVCCAEMMALIVEINEAGYVWLCSLCLHIDPKPWGLPKLCFSSLCHNLPVSWIRASSSLFYPSLFAPFSVPVSLSSHSSLSDSRALPCLVERDNIISRVWREQRVCCVGVMESRNLIKATLTFHFRPNRMWMEGWSSSKWLSAGVRTSRRPTFCLALQFVVFSSIFACIIKCVDTIAAIEYFCVRLSSLKNEIFLLSSRDEQVVNLTMNDKEAKETLLRQTLTAPTTFLSLAYGLHSSKPHKIVPLLPIETDGQFSAVTACWCQLDAHLCQCGIPIEH